MPKKNLIVILGPTAIGKTETSILIAKHFDAEIISADSRQFYKGLEIGTASPENKYLSAVKHHFIGTLDIKFKYDVFEYEKDVLKTLDELFITKDNAVLTGGSGLYINAVCNGIDELPDADPEIRKELNMQLAENGVESLRMQLKKLDPDFYQIVDICNPVRMMRAIEVCIITGIPFSKLRNQQIKPRNFSIIKIGLNLERDKLYERINQRVDNMMKDGLLNEAKRFYEFREYNALKTVGYKELFNYFDGKTSIEEAIEKIKTNTRHYAKRQLTWFNKDKSIKWFNPNNITEIITFISNNN
jgi:tRNA dimethylallyltransferase